MITVIETKDGFAPIGGNPVLTSLDGERRAPLRVILHDSWSDAERAAFGVFLAEPCAVPDGKRAVGLPSYERVGGKVVQRIAVEDAPPDDAMRLAARADPLTDLREVVDGLSRRVAALEVEAK